MIVTYCADKKVKKFHFSCRLMKSCRSRQLVSNFHFNCPSLTLTSSIDPKYFQTCDAWRVYKRMEYEAALYSTASSGTLQTKKDIQLCYPKPFTQSTCLKQMQKYVVRTLNNPYICSLMTHVYQNRMTCTLIKITAANYPVDEPIKSIHCYIGINILKW